MLEELRCSGVVLKYTVTQASLEQVFLKIAEAQVDVEREESAVALLRESELARSSLPAATVLEADF